MNNEMYFSTNFVLVVGQKKTMTCIILILRIILTPKGPARAYESWLPEIKSTFYPNITLTKILRVMNFNEFCIVLSYLLYAFYRIEIP